MYQDPVDRPQSDKEWKLIEKVVGSINTEQRRARRWGIFFKLMTFAYLFIALAIFAPSSIDTQDLGADGEFTAMVEVKGVIADGEEASADLIVTGLRKAFEAEGTRRWFYELIVLVVHQCNLAMFMMRLCVCVSCMLTFLCMQSSLI